eukprot:CAMPEP_0181175754 /NCGR_PEP_ID=MMETSP1096-20121128/4251_1 /TAXON_ID=156174 ORGANISM="Chrysochromulina ericina, Strain CCMP281" /NCGR_SAMPLE_ID=MMETSP1096 /ASSEMBLY_ACC=CAM_ASM_000453 /LENGTH=33 /DNA_ID= /DNA_START= /DNA_END= /DNA_ORIENTATION=
MAGHWRGDTNVSAAPNERASWQIARHGKDRSMR